MTNRLFDDDVPQAPPADAGVEMRVAETVEVPEAPDYGDADELSTRVPCFSDADRILRVWIDAGALVRVQVSPSWTHKLKGRDTLERHFRQAFALAAIDLATPDDPLPALPDGPADPLAGLPDDALAELERIPPLNKRTISAFTALFRDLDARLEAAIERADAVPQPVAQRVSARSRGATVTLDEAGWPFEVAFDRRWLDGADAGAIGANVLRAAGRARQRYVPPAEVDRAELDELTAEQDLLNRAYLAALLPHRAFRATPGSARSADEVDR